MGHSSPYYRSISGFPSIRPSNKDPVQYAYQKRPDTQYMVPKPIPLRRFGTRNLKSWSLPVRHGVLTLAHRSSAAFLPALWLYGYWSNIGKSSALALRRRRPPAHDVQGICDASAFARLVCKAYVRAQGTCYLLGNCTSQPDISSRSRVILITTRLASTVF